MRVKAAVVALVLAVALPEAARASFVTIDLGDHYNVTYSNAWVVCPCGFSNWFNESQHTFYGVPFLTSVVTDPLHGVGVGRTLPEAEIPVNSEVGTFHLLLSAGWSTCDAGNVVEIVGEDGSVRLAAWPAPEWSKGCLNAVAGWPLENPDRFVYYRAVPNPDPTRRVAAVRIVPQDPHEILLVALAVETPAEAPPSGGDCEALEAEVEGLRGSLASAEAERDTLLDHMTALESKAAALEAERNALRNALVEALARAENDLRATFRAPALRIAGATPTERLQAVVEAILGLNRGRKEGLYQELRCASDLWRDACLHSAAGADHPPATAGASHCKK